MFKKGALAILVAFLLLGSFLVTAKAQDNLPLAKETQDCLKAALSEERFAAIFSQNQTPTLDDETKAQSCFANTDTSSSLLNVAGTNSLNLDPTMADCLKSSLGDDRFQEIYERQSQPTDEEIQQGVACFKQSGKTLSEVAFGSKFALEVKQCLALAIGSERIQAIIKGAAPTLAERKAAEKCLGAVGPIILGLFSKISNDAISCLKTALGEDRLQSIISGESAPTEEERQKGYACLKSAPAEEITPEMILPPPPEIVPFLPVSSAITIEEVKTLSANQVVLKGKTAANGVIDLYVYSEPTLLTTQADSTGNWSYTIERNLDQGPHLAYAVARLQFESARSEESHFTLGTQTTEPIQEGDLGETKARRILIYLGISLIIVLGLIIYLIYSLKKQRESS